MLLLNTVILRLLLTFCTPGQCYFNLACTFNSGSQFNFLIPKSQQFLTNCSNPLIPTNPWNDMIESSKISNSWLYYKCLADEDMVQSSHRPVGVLLRLIFIVFKRITVEPVTELLYKFWCDKLQICMKYSLKHIGTELYFFNWASICSSFTLHVNSST